MKGGFLYRRTSVSSADKRLPILLSSLLSSFRLHPSSFPVWCLCGLIFLVQPGGTWGRSDRLEYL